MYSKKKHSDQRNSEFLSLGDAISQYLKYFKIEEKYNQTALLARWESLMGKTIASRTEEIYIYQKVLYIKVNSAPLKNELTLSKDKILDLIKNEIGEGVIIDVKIK